MARNPSPAPHPRRGLHPWRELRRQWGRTLKPQAPPKEPDEEAKDTAILTMLRALGVAMLASSQATNDVENTLYDIAATYNLTGIRIAVLPTLVILQLDAVAGPGEPQVAGAVSTETGSQTVVGGHGRYSAEDLAARAGRTDLDTVSTLSIRLDQAAAIDELVGEAQRGTLDPDDALGRLAAIRTSAPRFGPWMTVVGHTVLCLGFGLTLNPTAAAIPAYILLGAIVGGLLVLGKRLPTLASAMPVFASFIVTVITTLFLAGAAGDSPLKLIAPALVSFLPGLTLTVASIELTSNQIIAGASRVVYGVAQLLLLAFGVIAGLTVTHGGTEVTQVNGLGWWSAIAGVALVGVGFVFFLSAPKRSFLWILVALFASYGAQTIGAVFLGSLLSGFVGALVVVPLSRFLAQFRSAPPATVMMLASFWLLVPGALGFIGISESAGGTSVSAGAASVTTLVNTGISLFSIALGILVGTGLTRDFTRARITFRG
ncbi:threonine/serine ThrE exporter family protein [Subtercola sp. YIM 133946]|uniref:threonine/serine ThrE exporter family protein n=1 Tax=Subtercola sp. YIM 133946 TaxID=3118909 RepID=UPI002F93C8AA